LTKVILKKASSRRKSSNKNWPSKGRKSRFKDSQAILPVIEKPSNHSKKSKLKSRSWRRTYRVWVHGMCLC